MQLFVDCCCHRPSVQVWSPVVSKEQVLSWLRSEPPLLLWLPTLYRLFISQNIRHSVRCHTCKTTPITGLRWSSRTNKKRYWWLEDELTGLSWTFWPGLIKLWPGFRYRCMRCVNVHVCQSCFLTEKHTRKHKLHHPVLEFCTQVSPHRYCSLVLKNHA